MKPFELEQHVRNILNSNSDTELDLVRAMSLEAMPILAGFLDYERFQFKTAKAFSIIATGPSESIRAMIASGAVPKLVELLECEDINVAGMACSALGKFAANSSSARDEVLSHGVVEMIQKLLKLFDKKRMPLSFQRNITDLIRKLCENFNSPPSLESTEQILPVVFMVLRHYDLKIIEQACWAFVSLTGDTWEKIDVIANADCLPWLIHMLSYEEDLPILTPALETIANIATGKKKHIDKLLEANLLPNLVSLLNHDDEMIVKWAARTVSNVASGSEEHIQAILRSDIMNLMARVLDTDYVEAKYEVVWAVNHLIANGSCDQVYTLIGNFDIIEPFCHELKSSDFRTVEIVLETLQKLFSLAEENKYLSNCSFILTEAGLIDYLEDLESHPSPEISDTANHLLTTYFEINPDEIELNETTMMKMRRLLKLIKAKKSSKAQKRA